MDISTGEGAEKSGERGGTKTAMVVSNESSSRQRSEREKSSVCTGSRNRDWGNRGKPKIRRGGFRPGKERVGELGESKMETEVEVKMACPLGRRNRNDKMYVIYFQWSKINPHPPPPLHLFFILQLTTQNPSSETFANQAP